MPDTADLSRRKLLACMGLGLGAIYVVPMLANTGSAEAASRSSKASKSSKTSKPSRPDKPVKPSKPSRPHRVRKAISSRKDG